MKKAKSPPSSPPQALLVIDPNIRVVNNETYVGFEDIREGEVPSVGEVVRVLEEESGLEGLGEVTRLDHERSLIFLSISWRGLRFVSGPKAREIPAPPPTVAPWSDVSWWVISCAPGDTCVIEWLPSMCSEEGGKMVFRMSGPTHPRLVGTDAVFGYLFGGVFVVVSVNHGFTLSNERSPGGLPCSRFAGKDVISVSINPFVSSRWPGIPGLLALLEEG